jgi:hypothetical protein
MGGVMMRAVISSEAVDVEGHQEVHLEIEFRDSPFVIQVPASTRTSLSSSPNAR